MIMQRYDCLLSSADVEVKKALMQLLRSEFPQNYTFLCHFYDYYKNYDLYKALGDGQIDNIDDAKKLK